MKRVVVMSYVNPDVDGISSAVGYAEFLNKTGTDASAAIIGVAHGEARFVLQRFGIAPPETITDTGRFDAVILVDASHPNDLEGTVEPEKVVEIIDHRSAHAADAFPNAAAQIELVGAAATLVAERFRKQNIPISKESATLLCAGIISNTLNFRGSVTTGRDREAFAWLNQTAQLPEEFWRELFTAKSDVAGPMLAERLEGDFAWFIIAGRRVGIAEIEMMGVRDLIRERSGEMLTILERIGRETKMEFVFLNAIELEDVTSFLVAQESGTQQLLENALGVHFHGIVAERAPAVMRKQIVPLLTGAME